MLCSLKDLSKFNCVYCDTPCVNISCSLRSTVFIMNYSLTDFSKFYCLYCNNVCVNLYHGHFRCESCPAIIYFQIEDFGTIVKTIFAFVHSENAITVHVDNLNDDISVYSNHRFISKVPYFSNISPKSIMNRVLTFLTFS